MISDTQCAILCEAIYEDNRDFAVFDAGEDDGICWAIERSSDGDVIVLRGSHTVADWIRDLIALASPFTHHALGPVHPGFLLGMEHAWSEIKPQLMDFPPVVTGHSLGAARASILCGLMLLDGIKPARRVCFGSPKPGFSPLARIIASVPAASYRNGDTAHHDIVTGLPFSFPPEEYVHPEQLTFVAGAPLPGDPLGIFAFHRMAYYKAALQKAVT